MSTKETCSKKELVQKTNMFKKRTCSKMASKPS